MRLKFQNQRSKTKNPNQPSNNKSRNIDGLTKKAEKSENFFAELDEKSKSFFGFWFFVISILLLFFITVIVIATNIKRENFATIENSNDEIEISNLSDKLKNVHSAGVSTIRLTNSDFAKSAGVENSDFPLSSASFEIEEKGIYLKGKIKQSFVSFPVRVEIKTINTGNKFQFLVSPDNIENILIFSDDKKKIEQTLDKNIADLIEKNGLAAKEIKTYNGYLEISLVKGVL